MGDKPARFGFLNRWPRQKRETVDGETIRRIRRRIKRLEARVQPLEAGLNERVALLEDGLREQRFLNQRVADLGDVVAEMLGAAARGDRAEFEAARTKYSDGL